VKVTKKTNDNVPADGEKKKRKKVRKERRTPLSPG
jgi:hypothetical protein